MNLIDYMAAERDRIVAERSAAADEELLAHCERVTAAAHDWLWAMLAPFDGNTDLTVHWWPEALNQFTVVFDVAAGDGDDELNLYIQVDVPHNGPIVSPNGGFVGWVHAWSTAINNWARHTTESRRRFTNIESFATALEMVRDTDGLEWRAP